MQNCFSLFFHFFYIHLYRDLNAGCTTVYNQQKIKSYESNEVFVI
jgi:hypothetical protein